MSSWDMGRLFDSSEHRVIQAEGPIRSVLFPNEPFQGRPTEVFAFLGIPERAPGPVPGMVCVHGGGGRAFRQWVELWVGRGYAAIAMDLGGCGPDGKRLDHAGPAQDHESKFNPAAAWEDLWTYHAVAAILRAHSLLRREPGVDAARIGVTGISWGGYLTCIAAGVDTRLALAVPVYGCGFLQRNSAKDWMRIFAGMTPAQRQAWYDQCDPSVYLKNAVLPMLFVSGTNDFAYPLDILKMSCSLPKGPVTLCVRREMPHGHEPGWNAPEIQVFADQLLRGGVPLARLGALRREGRRVRAPLAAARRLARGELLFTPDAGAWQERKWQAAPATVTPDAVWADLPDQAAACYLSVEDDRGACVTTAHEEFRPS